MTDIRNDLHTEIDKVVTEKEREDAKDARIAALEARVNEPNPGPDLSRFDTAIGALNDKFDTLLAAITTNRGAGETATPEARVEANADDTDDDDEEESAPKVVTQMTTRAEIEEKPPRPSHFLFRRLGR